MPSRMVPLSLSEIHDLALTLGVPIRRPTRRLFDPSADLDASAALSDVWMNLVGLGSVSTMYQGSPVPPAPKWAAMHAKLEEGFLKSKTGPNSLTVGEGNYLAAHMTIQPYRDYIQGTKTKLYDDPKLTMSALYQTASVEKGGVAGLVNTIKGAVREVAGDALDTQDWGKLMEVYPALVTGVEEAKMAAYDIGGAFKDAYDKSGLHEAATSVQQFAMGAVDIGNEVGSGISETLGPAMGPVGAIIGAGVGILFKAFIKLFEINNEPEEIHKWFDDTGGDYPPGIPFRRYFRYFRNVSGEGNGPIITVECREVEDKYWRGAELVTTVGSTDLDNKQCCVGTPSNQEECQTPAITSGAKFNLVRTAAGGPNFPVATQGSWVGWWDGGFGPWQNGLKYPGHPSDFHRKALELIMNGRTASSIPVNGVPQIAIPGDWRNAVDRLCELRLKSSWQDWRTAELNWKQYQVLMFRYGVPTVNIDTLGWMFWFVPLPGNFSQVYDVTAPGAGQQVWDAKDGTWKTQYNYRPTMIDIVKAKMSLNKSSMKWLLLAGAVGLVTLYALRDD